MYCYIKINSIKFNIKANRIQNNHYKDRRESKSLLYAVTIVVFCGIE